MAIRVSRITGEVRRQRQSPFARFQARYSDYANQVQVLEAEFSKRCRKLRGRPAGKQRDDIRRLLRMRHLYPAFALTALKQTRQIATATPEIVQELADSFDPFRSVVDETAFLKWFPRTSGSSRIVVDFGKRRRMHQHVIARILRQIHPPREDQFLFNGGMPKALSAIEDAISQGFTHVCEIDFVGFYGSVIQADIAEVMRPLPSNVTSHVIWDECLRGADNFSVPRRLRHAATPEPPEGLFLGSATSPIVGEVLIARLLEAAQLPSVITYADNLLVLGRSEGEVVARIQALREVLDDPPLMCVSGLSVREGTIRDISEPTRPSSIGIEFSSHESIFDESSTDPKVRGWRPSDSRLGQFEIAEREFVTIDQLERAISRVSNWRRYYSSWPEGDLHESRYLAALKMRRFALRQTPRNRSSARAAVVDAFLTARRLGHDDVDYMDFMPGLGSEAELQIANEIEDQLLTRLSP